MGQETGHEEQSFEEIADSVSLTDDLQVLAEELLETSDYITPKPDTTSTDIIGGHLDVLQNLDISPLDLLGLLNIQNGQISDLVNSRYYSSFLSGSIEEFGNYIFDSVLSGLNWGTDSYAFGTDLFSHLDKFHSQDNRFYNLIEPAVSSTPINRDAVLTFGEENANLGVSAATFGAFSLVGAEANYNGSNSNLGGAYLYDSATSSLITSIVNPSGASDDSFGTSVSLYGDYALIGASGDDTGADGAGSAYIYNITTGTLLHILNNPTPEINDNYGGDVAISGNYAVVGAYNDNTGGNNGGSAYVYNVTSGALLYTLNHPSPQSTDYFGRNVDISGNYAIIGSHGDDTGASGAGSAYIFDLTTGLLFQTLNNPTPNISDFFGRNVAISGNHALVGAFRDDTGAGDTGSAYIFNVATGALMHTLNNPTPEASDLFGFKVSLFENYALISARGDNTNDTNAGSAYIYDVTTGALLHTLNNPFPDNGDLFGMSVSLSGEFALVGAFEDDDFGATDSGSVFVYRGDFDDDDAPIIGNYKNETIYGLNGNDSLDGASGDDVLYGGYGANDLTGGSGADHFMFEASSAFDAIDSINDFNLAQNDVIDVSDVLTGYTLGVDDISDFVRFVDVGADTIMEIDANGLAGGVSFVGVATVVGGAGLDANTLETSGNLDTVI